MNARYRTLLRSVPGVAAGLFCLPAAAATYHVAQSGGSDTGDGSEVAPFATISACAKIAQAGDTCTVHAGTYRETVSPAHSGTATQPILFQVARGECATVSGAEPFTAAFTETTPNVWVAQTPEAIQQMFSGGVIVWEAQWPNRTPGAIIDLPKGVAGQGTGQDADGGGEWRLVDPAIPPGDWTGATVFILPGQRWQSDSRPVKAYDEATHTITLDTTVPWAEAAIQPMPSNPYYLYGSVLALDTQDEWVLQNGSLYYYSTDDPRGHALEYKKRSYAFDIAQSYVRVVGFHVFASAVRLNGSHDTVDSLSIEYPSHFRTFDAYYTSGDGNQIAGDDNVWKNSLIAKSGSAGLIIAGNHNLVENNIVSDVVYQATNHAGIDMTDWTKPYQGNLIVYNTVNRSGRSGIFLFGDQAGRVLYNRVSDWALLTNDMGGIYAWGTDGQGTEIAYNDVGGSTAFWSNGIYMDDKTKHFVVHHNAIHDSSYFAINIKEENDFFNNTIANVGMPFIIYKDNQLGVWTNTNLAKVINNVSDGTLLVRVGVLPTVVTDYGYFEVPVHATAGWQHVQIAFSSFYQPGWSAPKPFDLTAIQQIAFTPEADGDFEFDVDNLSLTGTSPVVLDDFDSGGGANALGGYAWGGGSGDGVASTSGALTYVAGGSSSSSTKYAHFAGTMVQGDDTWGLMNESLPNADLSAYTGIAFDIRGKTKGLRVLATGDNSPIQQTNDSCPLSGTTTPACALSTGTPIAGITDGFTGPRPDLGAFASGTTPWSAGAQRPVDGATCGKITDVSSTLPPPYTPTWGDGGTDAAAPDAGSQPMADASADGTAAPPAAGDVSTGCGCRVTEKNGANFAWLAVSALGALLRRRRVRSCGTSLRRNGDADAVVARVCVALRLG